MNTIVNLNCTDELSATERTRANELRWNGPIPPQYTTTPPPPFTYADHLRADIARTWTEWREAVRCENTRQMERLMMVITQLQERLEEIEPTKMAAE